MEEIKNNKEEVPLQYYIEKFAAADPMQRAKELNLPYENDRFQICMLGTAYSVRWPDAEISLLNQDVSNGDTYGDAAGSNSEKPAGDAAGSNSEERAGDAAGSNSEKPAGDTSGPGFGADAPAPGSALAPHSVPAPDSALALHSAQAQIFLLRYLLFGKPLPFGGKYKAFRELPWGEVYIKPFTGRCLTRMAWKFNGSPEKFAAAAEALGGQPLDHADAAFRFDLIGEYHLLFYLWQGDDEFPPNAQVEFSDNFAAGFQAEDSVVAAEMIIGAISAAMKKA